MDPERDNQARMWPLECLFVGNTNKSEHVSKSSKLMSFELSVFVVVVVVVFCVRYCQGVGGVKAFVFCRQNAAHMYNLSDTSLHSGPCSMHMGTNL